MPRGPAPKHPSTRRRTNKPAAGEWQELPRTGPAGRAPKWPLGEVSEDALILWRRLWKAPQACKWVEVPGCDLMVARYVKLTEAIRGELRAEEMKSVYPELRLIEDGLGLSPKGMQALRWMPAQDEDMLAVVAPVSTIGDYRARLNAK